MPVINSPEGNRVVEVSTEGCKPCANTLPRQWVVKGMRGNIITRTNSLRAASRACDRLDNAYGASVHSVHPVLEAA